MLNLNKNSPGSLKDFILIIAGNKERIKGYRKEIPKLIKVFLRRYIWVFLYTAQKQEM